MRRCKSRHAKFWAMADGRVAWCWECGAVRRMETFEQRRGDGHTAVRFSMPIDKRWTYPVGPDGENPATRRGQ